MPVFRYDKLVRDNIPAMSEAAGHGVVQHELTPDEHLLELCKKSSEEAAEILVAVRAGDVQAITEELADLDQVQKDTDELKRRIAEMYGISLGDIENARRKKFAEKGGFLKGVYIETVDIPTSDDSMLARLRSEPEKYPEEKTYDAGAK